jgi:hypothetical protein
MSAEIVQLPIRLPAKRRRGDHLLYLGQRISRVDAQIRSLRELKKRLRLAWENECDRARREVRYE